MTDVYTSNAKEVLRNGIHFADVLDDAGAEAIVRALNHCDEVHAADSLLIECQKAADMAFQSLSGAIEMFGYLHAVQFGIDQHLRKNGWSKPGEPITVDDEELPF